MYALIEQPHRGWANPLIVLPLSLGLLALAVFVVGTNVARLSADASGGAVCQPQFPRGQYRDQVLIYGALSTSTFVVTIFVQEAAGYSALAAGLTFLPVTALMFLLSSYFGKLAGRYGPRLFMAAGPMVAGVGFLLMLRLDEVARYWSDLFPGVLLLGLGLALTVAPLTAAILGAVDKQQSGIASAVNNALCNVSAGWRQGRDSRHRHHRRVGKLTVAGFPCAALWFIAALLFAGGMDLRSRDHQSVGPRRGGVNPSPSVRIGGNP